MAASLGSAWDEPGWPPNFFAFDNGVGRGELSTEEQARLVAEYGYAGLGYTGTQGIPEILAALDARGLTLFSIYVGAKVGPEGATVDPGLSQAIKQLEGRPTVIWLYLQSNTASSPDHDPAAAALVRTIADEAKQAGLDVVIYPHAGFYVERVDDAVRLVKLVDRPNVGVTFNLCHFLRLQDASELDRVLEAAKPYLKLVSINGADPVKGAEWERLIQPLGQGSYDVADLMRRLKTMGYRGPVGLQCYALKEPRSEHLPGSMAAWKRILSQVP